jgi:hypothetical protein
MRFLSQACEGSVLCLPRGTAFLRGGSKGTVSREFPFSCSFTSVGHSTSLLCSRDPSAHSEILAVALHRPCLLVVFFNYLHLLTSKVTNPARMIFNYKHAHNLVLTWRQEALKAAPERKLTFLYLANDVIQQSRKKGPKFIDEFGTSLPARPSLCTYFNGWID